MPLSNCSGGRGPAREWHHGHLGGRAHRLAVRRRLQPAPGALARVWGLLAAACAVLWVLVTFGGLADLRHLGAAPPPVAALTSTHPPNPPQIVEVFARSAPIERLRCHGRPWEGLMSMQPLIAELHGLLPASFADLQQGAGGRRRVGRHGPRSGAGGCRRRRLRGTVAVYLPGALICNDPTCCPAATAPLPADFACGVVGADGRHLLLDRGSLPAAVTASAAIPVIFSPVEVPGQRRPRLM